MKDLSDKMRERLDRWRKNAIPVPSVKKVYPGYKKDYLKQPEITAEEHQRRLREYE